MASDDFGSATINTEELLSIFTHGRIGELIETIIGKSELREMFDANQDFQNEPGEYKGKPSGIIALDLGIVNRDVKNALLVVQASCRAVSVLKGEVDARAYDHEDFKFVGSDRDPETLKQSQASWQLANIIVEQGKAGPYSEMAFEQVAAWYIEEASKVLDDNGFSDASQKLTALVGVLRPQKVTQFTPNMYAKELLRNNISDELHAVVEKLEGLTQAQGGQSYQFGADGKPRPTN